MNITIKEDRKSESFVPVLNNIYIILDKWVESRYDIAKRMADNSPIQIEYKNKTKDKLEKLLEYVKTNFKE